MSSDSGADRAAPNKDFLSNYLKGLESGNKRAIARNAARGAQQAVGASGAAALRPSLHKAANKGVDSVRRAVLMSAEQSKQTLCVALLREVAQVFGYNLALIVDGEDQAQEEAEQLEPLALTDLKARLTIAGNSSLPAAAAGQQHKGDLANGDLLQHRLQLAAFRSLGLAGRTNSRLAAASTAAAAKRRALRRNGSGAGAQQQQAQQAQHAADGGSSSSDYEEVEQQEEEEPAAAALDGKVSSHEQQRQQQMNSEQQRQDQQAEQTAAAAATTGKGGLKGVFSRLGSSAAAGSGIQAINAAVPGEPKPGATPSSNQKAAAAAAAGGPSGKPKPGSAAAALTAAAAAAAASTPGKKAAAVAPADAASAGRVRTPIPLPGQTAAGSRKRPAAASAVAPAVDDSSSPATAPSPAKPVVTQARPVAAAALAEVLISSRSTSAKRQRADPQQQQQQQQQQRPRLSEVCSDRRGLATDDDGWQEVMQDADELGVDPDQSNVVEQDQKKQRPHIQEDKQQQQQQQAVRQQGKGRPLSGQKQAGQRMQPPGYSATVVAAAGVKDHEMHGTELLQQQQQQQEHGEGNAASGQRVSVMQRLGKR